MKRHTRRLLTAVSVLALCAAGLSGFMVGLAQAAHPGSALLGLAQVAARSVVPAGPAPNAGSGGGPSETAATTAAGRAGSAPALSGGTAGPVTSGASGGQTQHDAARAGGAAQERIHACGGVPTASLADLLTAVDEAAALGAPVISNSYGAAEFSAETSFDAHFNRPGIAITASSGDSGFGVQYPAASQYVTAVGGTTLTRSASARGWSEAAWSGAGSGCSAFEPRPTWQASNPNVAGVCPDRATADVSAVADPSTGVSVFDSFNFHGSRGWLVFGGTSVSSPIIASVFALGAATPSPASYPYAHSSSLFDVTSGSNGTCGSILCNAAPGWDGPTGLGTPDGAGGF